MTTDGQPAIAAGTTREKLSAAREVARRLSLGTPGERVLRALLIEVCTIVLGDDHPMHEDLINSGALYEAPAVAAPSTGTVRYHVTQHAPPPARAQAPVIPSPSPTQFQPRATPGVARNVAPATRPLTIDEAARGFVRPPPPPPSNRPASERAIQEGNVTVPSHGASSPAAPEAPIPIRPPAMTSDGNPDPEGEAFLSSLEEKITEEGG